ncbi:MAG TPA: AMP-binding protein [Mycobacteriales bacterium]|nr:AMP-binding protein [Mycobacteriales bacterium]
MDLTGARILLRSGLLRPGRPDRLLGMALQAARWDLTPAGGYAVAAARDPHGLALVDDEGALTFREVDERSDRVAGELRARGVRTGDAVGLLARNGRGFVVSLVALSKCGADVLLLNTGFAPAQVAAVLDREDAAMVVHDADLAAVVMDAGAGRLLVTTEELDEAARAGNRPAPVRAGRRGRVVILTSGTTGAPRGAARTSGTADDAVAFLSRIPLRAGGRTVIAAPTFHAWGFGHLTMAMLLGSAAVLQRRFDPKAVLAAVQEHRASALVVVPVMLDKLLDADPSAFDTSSLEVIASSGSTLPGELATRVLDSFGPVLYNLYGSTEAAYAAVATPEDLLADPRTAGRPPYGVTLRVVDEAGVEVPPGTQGRIFVGSGLAFGGYTDGSDKERLDGLVATGDLGVVDAEGRLTVLGRDDDMVVIGGENVHLNQVEDALLSHPAVVECAVTAQEDLSFGVRLVAHVVGSAPEQELKERVREQVARFAVPREVRYVDALPRNSTGKVVKRELVGGPA